MDKDEQKESVVFLKKGATVWLGPDPWCIIHDKKHSLSAEEVATIIKYNPGIDLDLAVAYLVPSSVLIDPSRDNVAAPIKILEDGTLQITVPTDICMRVGRVLLEDGDTIGNLYYLDDGED